MNQLFVTHLRSFGLSILILLFASCTGSSSTKSIEPSSQSGPTSLATPVSTLTFNIPSTIEASSLTPYTVATNSTTHPLWETIQNWILANQIRTLLIDQSSNLWTGGPGGVIHWDLKTGKPTIYVIGAQPDKTNVVALAQTPDNTIWVGTFGNGISKFDNMNWQSFTDNDGLPGNYVISLIASKGKGIWADIQKMENNSYLGQEFHFGHFDGNRWDSKVGGGFWWIAELPDGSVVGAKGDTGIAKHDSVIGIYDGHEWKDLGLMQQTINAVTVAPDGTIWVATENNIFLYVNEIWESVTPPWAGKDFASVSSIAVAEDGTAWFGFSFGAGDFGKCGLRMDYAKERGVYRYDGKTWTHFTSDDGLVDDKICAITFDLRGNVWFGSFDKGVSSFDGHHWKTYTIP